jgi:hypothetical protein
LERPKIFKIIIATLILLAIFLGGFFVRNYYIQKEELEFSRNLANLRQDFQKENSSPADYLIKLKALDKQNLARSKDDENNLQLEIGKENLILSYFPEGVDILKRLAENENNNNLIRGKAMEYLANFYDLYPDDNFEKKIFNDSFFSQFIRDDQNNISKAFKNLDEFTNSIYPNAASSYRIARWYSKELLNNSTLSSSNRDAYFSKIQDNLKKGDDLSKTLQSSLSYNALAMRLKAQILENLYFAKQENVFSDEVETFYKQPLVLRANKVNDNFSEPLSVYSRFYYAVFLAKLDRNKRANDIRNILTPLYDVSIRNYTLFKFLKIIKDDNRNPYYNDIAILSNIDPKFKSLMDQL